MIGIKHGDMIIHMDEDTVKVTDAGLKVDYTVSDENGESVDYDYSLVESIIQVYFDNLLNDKMNKV